MLRRAILSVTALLAVVALSAQAVQTPQPPQVDIALLGPQVGDTALDFSLSDQTGRIQTLETVAGPKGTMLVFFRSADW
jgi:cytochrome oxidase Cu insertion factor (SCO1/SenC/PrrC family)